ncbi:MAG: hypothetical protein V4467_00755 [Patescibacteria group bacterium]
MEHKTRNTEHAEILGHHANAIFGDVNAKEKLFELLERSWKIETKGNPDFSYQKFESLNIENARILKEFQEKKSFVVDAKKIFVIEADSITLEAQNSLLKVFEEPTENTYFFLLGECVKNLIPTLLSRVAKIEMRTAPAAAAGAKEFLSLSLPKRLAFVKKLADDIKDEKKTKAEALRLIEGVEEILYQKFKDKKGLSPKILVDIEKCRDYMLDRSASVKMLLEYVSLIVPLPK